MLSQEQSLGEYTHNLVTWVELVEQGSVCRELTLVNLYTVATPICFQQIMLNKGQPLVLTTEHLVTVFTDLEKWRPDRVTSKVAGYAAVLWLKKCWSTGKLEYLTLLTWTTPPGTGTR